MDSHEMAIAYLNAPDQAKKLELAASLYNEIKLHLRIRFSNAVPESLIEDVLQDALIAVFEKMESYKGSTEAKFQAWCRGIFSNKRNDMWRRRLAFRTIYMEPEALLIVVDKSGELKAFEPGEKHDLVDLISRLKGLKAYCLQLLWKRADGMRLTEIAKQMNLKFDAVRMRMDRCKKQAIKCLKRKRT